MKRYFMHWFALGDDLKYSDFSAFYDSSVGEQIVNRSWLPYETDETLLAALDRLSEMDAKAKNYR